MNNGPMGRVWYADPTKNQQRHQVGILAVDVEMELAIIVHNRAFIKVPLSELEWAAWE